MSSPISLADAISTEARTRGLSYDHVADDWHVWSCPAAGINVHVAWLPGDAVDPTVEICGQDWQVRIGQGTPPEVAVAVLGAALDAAPTAPR